MAPRFAELNNGGRRVTCPPVFRASECSKQASQDINESIVWAFVARQCDESSRTLGGAEAGVTLIPAAWGMEGWGDGRMDEGRNEGWRHGWRYQWREVGIDEGSDGGMDGGTKGVMEGWMKGWRDGWRGMRDAWIDGGIKRGMEG